MKRAWLPIGSFLLSSAAIIASMLIPKPAEAQSRLAQPRTPVSSIDEAQTYPIQGMADRIAEEVRELNERSKYLSDAQVIGAINKGIERLLLLCTERLKFTVANKMSVDGHLVMGVYALLYMYRLTGDEKLHFSSKEMAPLVKFLCEVKTNETYILGLQASGLALLPDKAEFRAPLRAVCDLLIKGARTTGNYWYKVTDPANQWDNSNSQYGILGIWACDDAGIEIPNAFWRMCDGHWRRTQTASGGWGYRSDNKNGETKGAARPEGTPSMTAAGLASLYVMSEHLDTTVRLDPVPDQALEKGLAWVTKDYPATRITLYTDLYTAYGVERVGLASGYKYFGKHDWYRDTASSLVKYGPESWKDRGEIVGCSYALLFLARGRTPVAFTKLQYNGPWNARPRDVANLSKWLYKRTERYINWQIVSMKFSEPEDWLDGPVLVITGHKDPKFNKEELDKLRRFVRAGGLIFSTADGDDKEFTESIVKNYAPAIFENAFEMRQLPRTHYVYNMDYKLEKDKNNDLMGLSNGVRECWIHSPKDMGATWQKYAKATNEYFDIPQNIYLYASGRHSLRSKLNSIFVQKIETNVTNIQIARLKYAGNYDPEPGAWERFSKLMARERASTFELTTVTAEEVDPTKNPILVMTGSTGFSLAEPQIKAMRKYLDNGGFLIADDIGGGGAFTASLQAALSRIFKGDEGKEVNTKEHPVITGKLQLGIEPNLEDLFRKYATSTEMRGHKSRVWEYKIKDRVVAVVFETDVTSGLLGTNTWGIYGYTSAASEAIMWNAVMYAKANPPPPPPPAPAATAPK